MRRFSDSQSGRVQHPRSHKKRRIIHFEESFSVMGTSADVVTHVMQGRCLDNGSGRLLV